MSSNKTISVSRSKRDFWWTYVDTAILLDKGLSIKARFVFAVLCTFTSTQKRPWPSDEEVADAAGVSVETVRKAYHEINTKAVRFVDYIRRNRFYEPETEQEEHGDE